MSDLPIDRAAQLKELATDATVGPAFGPHSELHICSDDATDTAVEQTSPPASDWHTCSDELAWDIAEPLGKRSSVAPIQAWREVVLTRALEARKKRASWTGNYTSLLASAEEVQKSRWQGMTGILRVCFATSRVAQASSTIEAYRRSPWKEGVGSKLFSHVRDSLMLVKSDAQCSEHASEGDWHERHLWFPQDVAVTLVSKFMVLDRSVNGHTALLELRKKRQDMLDAPTDASDPVEVMFWLVLDIPRHSALSEPEELLRYAYRKICASDFVIPRRLQNSRLIKEGIAGLEGVAVVREAQPCCSSALVPNVDHYPCNSLWGGAAWTAWIVTLFQRWACMGLATTTGCLGQEISEGSTPDIPVEEYLRQIIGLESMWMYREISRSTEVDQMYRDLQLSLDVEGMWNDVREQTELLARHVQSERQRKLGILQTIAGMVVGSMLFLATIFGSNFFDSDTLGTMVYQLETKDSLVKWLGHFGTAKLVEWITCLVICFTVLAITWFYNRTNPYHPLSRWIKRLPPRLRRRSAIRARESHSRA